MNQSEQCSRVVCPQFWDAPPPPAFPMGSPIVWREEAKREPQREGRLRCRWAHLFNWRSCQPSPGNKRLADSPQSWICWIWGEASQQTLGYSDLGPGKTKVLRRWRRSVQETGSGILGPLGRFPQWLMSFCKSMGSEDGGKRRKDTKYLLRKASLQTHALLSLHLYSMKQDHTTGRGRYSRGQSAHSSAQVWGVQ
jgi:hypothetical protein